MKSTWVQISTVCACVFSLAGAGCSHSAGSSTSASGVTTTAATSTKLLVANSVMNGESPIYAYPTSGGLVGNLYIEPRSMMNAQDDQVSGCGQWGAGVPGLDSFLSKPNWITQTLLFTDLYVPAQSFLNGFPAGNSGSQVPVLTYFAIDSYGTFHLGIGDTAGFYQFALIADDSARLKMQKPDGTYSMIVDDEKPLSYNTGTCLPQTQSPHMSCTSDWSSQTSSKVVTVYLKPGDTLPIEMSYWQGPGGGIAMMAFYRKVQDPSNTNALIDPACGQEWNFSASGSDLNTLKQTWKPISIENLNPLPQ